MISPFLNPSQSEKQCGKMEKGMAEITDTAFSEQNEEKEAKEEESVDAKESGEEEKNSGDNSTSPEAKMGGVSFSSLISSILHPSGGGDERNGSAAVDERDGTAAVDEMESGAASDGGGGLMIDNIVSHLPAPLADDAAPATEEASILIHSIVHD